MVRLAYIIRELPGDVGRFCMVKFLEWILGKPQSVLAKTRRAAIREMLKKEGGK